MLKPVATNNTANRTSWNQSTPKCHRYSGTAVRLRTNVPIKNELVVQLMRPVGIRKIKRGVWEGSPAHCTARPRTTSPFVQVWTLPQCPQVNFCVFTLAVRQRFSSIVRPVSVNFDVEGQRTSKLFRLAPALGFGRL